MALAKPTLRWSKMAFKSSVYVTLSAGQIQTQKLPPQLKLPRCPAPVLRISRLGVDQAQQRKGTGQHLLSFALQMALEFSEHVGVYAVVIDVKNDRAKAFYSRLGFSESLDDPLFLYLQVAMLKNAVTSPTPKMS